MVLLWRKLDIDEAKSSEVECRSKKKNPEWNPGDWGQKWSCEVKKGTVKGYNNKVFKYV